MSLSSCVLDSIDWCESRVFTFVRINSSIEVIFPRHWSIIVLLMGNKPTKYFEKYHEFYLDDYKYPKYEEHFVDRKDYPIQECSKFNKWTFRCNYKPRKDKNKPAEMVVTNVKTEITFVENMRSYIFTSYETIGPDYACSIYGIFYRVDKSNIYMLICRETMDFSIEDAYKTQSFTSEFLQVIASHLIEALFYFHSNNRIIWRLKPSNILLNKSGQVKLCDYGINPKYQTYLKLKDSTMHTCYHITRYMPPECLYGEEYDLSADIWQLGVTFAEIALGKYPLDNRKSHQEIQARINSSNFIGDLEESLRKKRTFGGWSQFDYFLSFQ